MLEDQGTHPVRYSPAPWEPLPRQAFSMLAVGDAQGNPVAFIVEHHNEHDNWKMVAAAPEMYLLMQEQAEVISMWLTMHSGDKNLDPAFFDRALKAVQDVTELQKKAEVGQLFDTSTRP